MFSDQVKVFNWFNVPSTAGTSVTSGLKCKVVQVHAVQEGEKTVVFWELCRNFMTNPLFDCIFEYAMRVTLYEDQQILEACTPEKGNKFNSKYDKLQMLYRHAIRRKARKKPETVHFQKQNYYDI